MKKIIIQILILFSFGILKMEAQKNEAADEILSKILKAEVALKEEKQLNQGDLKEIVCLTNIEPKNGDGNYFGISFFPTESEIQIWKDWFEKNKAKISYSTDSEIHNKEFGGKVIQVEYENGKFRNNVCDDDKKFQDWVKQNKKN
ncbi:hypothetical protein C8C84_2629 [Flavobacterium sp. 102]|nr:hypothetical protein C8C84_2629 [Flavobacterium sp. 102]